MAPGDHESDSTDFDDAIDELEEGFDDLPYDDFDEDFDEDFDADPEDLELDDDFEDELDETAIEEDLDELDELDDVADASGAPPAGDADTGTPDDDTDDENEDIDVELLAQAAEDDDLDEALEGLREDEFICRSCYLAKGPSQLADARRMICVDCV